MSSTAASATPAPTSFVSGFDASATGGTISTINFQTQALTGSRARVTTTAEGPAITDPTTINSLNALSRPAPTATAAYGADGIVRGQAILSRSPPWRSTAPRLRRPTPASTPTATPRPSPPPRRWTSPSPTTPPATAPRGLVEPRRLQSDFAGNRRHPVSSSNASAMLTAVGAALAGGHQLLGHHRRHAGQNDGGRTLNSALTTNYANGASLARRCGHERRFHPPAGSADAAAARHPVVGDRQPEQPAHPEAVQRLVSNSHRRLLAGDAKVARASLSEVVVQMRRERLDVHLGELAQAARPFSQLGPAGSPRAGSLFLRRAPRPNRPVGARSSGT